MNMFFSQAEFEEDEVCYDENSFFNFTGTPMDLHDVDGFLKEVRDWVIRYSYPTKNDDMALSSAITTVMTLSGLLNLMTPTSSGTNLYIINITKTGGGKNWPLKAPGEILKSFGLSNICRAGFASDAVLTEILIKSPVLLSSIDEIGQALLARCTSKTKKGYEEGLSAMLRELWSMNGNTYRGTEAVSRPGSKSIDNPRFGLIGADTEKNFFDALGGAGSISSGFYNRLTLVPARPSIECYNEPSEKRTIPEELLKRFTAVLPNPSQVPQPFRIKWSEANTNTSVTAKQAWEWFRRTITKRCEEIPELEPYVSRTAEQALRLATIRAVSRELYECREPKVTIEDVYWGASYATASAKFAITVARKYLSENENQRNHKMVKNALEELWKKGSEVKHSALLNKVDNVLKSKELLLIIGELKQQNYLHHKQYPTKGRPLIVYIKGKEPC